MAQVVESLRRGKHKGQFIQHSQWRRCWRYWPKSWQWRHNGHNGVSNHQPPDCLLNRLFLRRSKKTSKLRVTGLCVGNSPATGEFPAQMASNAENVIIGWRHHVSRKISRSVRERLTHAKWSQCWNISHQTQRITGYQHPKVVLKLPVCCWAWNFEIWMIRFPVHAIFRIVNMTRNHSVNQ